MASPNSSRDSGSKRGSSTKFSKIETPKAACVCTGHVSSSQRSHPSSLTRPLLSQSCSNYLESRVPSRIMFYNRGGWQDFPQSVVQTMITAFKDERTSIRFSIGNVPLILDFLSMSVVNLHTRKQKSIAWIDEAEKGFFPTIFGIDDDDCEYWDFEIVDNGLQIKKEVVSQSKVVEHVKKETGADSTERPLTIEEAISTRLDTLDRGSEVFRLAQNAFLSGMGPFATTDNIVAIHRYAPKDIIGKEKLQKFETQIRKTTKARGGANVQFGWLGAGKCDLAEVLNHGFAMTHGKVVEEGPLGKALYLPLESRSFASLKFCNVDEEGTQCMLLCRVIVGNWEQVHPGSTQCCPSSGNYDCGVDNSLRPRCLLVWPTHLSTHVCPEYLFSFKLPPNIRDYFFRLQDVRLRVAPRPNASNLPNPPSISEASGPTSKHIPFKVLLMEILDKVHHIVVELLMVHLQECKDKIITNDEFFTTVKHIVGEQILFDALRKLKQDRDARAAVRVVCKETIPTSNPNGGEED